MRFYLTLAGIVVTMVLAQSSIDLGRACCSFPPSGEDGLLTVAQIDAMESAERDLRSGNVLTRAAGQYLFPSLAIEPLADDELFDDFQGGIAVSE